MKAGCSAHPRSARTPRRGASRGTCEQSACVTAERRVCLSNRGTGLVPRCVMWYLQIIYIIAKHVYIYIYIRLYVYMYASMCTRHVVPAQVMVIFPAPKMTKNRSVSTYKYPNEGPLGPLGFDFAQHRSTLRPSVVGIRSKALRPSGLQ